jgi:hypothetical protein
MTPVVFSTVPVQNFSYRRINGQTAILLSAEQQMIVYQSMEIELGGELELEGEVVVYE